MRYVIRILLILMSLIMIRSVLFAEELDWETLKTEKIVNPPESVTLEYKFDTSKVRQYEMTAASEGSVIMPGETEKVKMQTNTKLKFNQEASGPDKDGLWQVYWKNIQGATNIQGFKEFQISLPDMLVAMEKYGAVKEIKGTEKLTQRANLPGSSSVDSLISQLKSPGFPQRPLKLSDLWEREFTVQTSSGQTVKLTTAYQIVGFERVSNYDCVKIRSTYETPFTLPLQTSEDGKEQDASSVIGVEKGEFQTYFAYNEGKIVLSYGVIELSADTKKVEKAEDSSPPGGGSEAATPSVNKPHEINIKYHISTQLAGESPIADSKGEQK